MSVLVLKGGVAKSPKIVQIADFFSFQSNQDFNNFLLFTE